MDLGIKRGFTLRTHKTKLETKQEELLPTANRETSLVSCCYGAVNIF